MHFRVFRFIGGFPVVDHSVTQRLVRAGEDGILGDRALQFLELMFDFLTFSLLLVELSLQFGGHAVVTLLGLLQIESNLMDVG